MALLVSTPTPFFRTFSTLLSILLLLSSSISAQDVGEIRNHVQSWVNESASDYSLADLSGPVKDLDPIREMLGDARIVAISESNHGVREQMLFRNRLFRYLVENQGFEAIVLESGLVESKVLNDYVLGNTAAASIRFELGFSNGFDQFQQNWNLVEWLREYNLQLPEDARKIQIFGMDVSGSPYQNDASRNPDTPLRFALSYLGSVDTDSAAFYSEKFERFLPVLADIFDYGQLTTDERNLLTASIFDLQSFMQRRRIQFSEVSGEYEYAWGLQAAVAAGQIDDWFRQIPLGWTPDDGFGWNDVSQETRDRVMFDNLQWVLGQVDSQARVVVFASVGHMASVPIYLPEDGRNDMKIPFGHYARSKYGENFVNLLNLAVGGSNEFCFLPVEERTPREFGPPPAGSAEDLFTLANKNHYFIDLRNAPEPVQSWLEQDKEHWNGGGSWAFPTLPAFDIVHYMRPNSPDCVEKSI